MLKFQRALLGELLFAFVGVLSVVTAVVFAGVTLQLFYTGEGVGLGIMLELIPSLMPVALSYSLPFSWLAAVTMVLGRMSADREITALRSAGLHLRVIVVPTLALAVVISLVATVFNGFIVPDAQRALRAGVRRYVGVFLNSLKDVDRRVTLKNGRFSFSRYERGSFYDVELERRRPSGELEFKVIARRATIHQPPEAEAKNALYFEFENAHVLQPTRTGAPEVGYFASTTLQTGRVERVGASVLFNEFFGTQRFVERPKDMDLPDLLYADLRGGVWRGSIARVQVALHGRITAGLAPLVMGLFAAGMALLVPAAGRRVRHFLLGFLPPVLVYFPLFLAGPYLGRLGTVPAWLVMWIPVIVVSALGMILIALVYRR